MSPIPQIPSAADASHNKSALSLSSAPTKHAPTAAATASSHLLHRRSASSSLGVGLAIGLSLLFAIGLGLAYIFLWNKKHSHNKPCAPKPKKCNGSRGRPIKKHPHPPCHPDPDLVHHTHRHVRHSTRPSSSRSSSAPPSHSGDTIPTAVPTNNEMDAPQDDEIARYRERQARKGRR